MIVTLPGVSWDDIAAARVPVIDGLIRTGAVAAMSVRSALPGSTPLRGYLTLGAGNRASAEVNRTPLQDRPLGQVALRSDAPYENGTAGRAVARRVAHPRAGALVSPGLPALGAGRARAMFGTDAGALGEALARRGVSRAAVVAGDLAPSPGYRAMRRGAVLVLADESGTVDEGTLDGLVRPAPGAPFGVDTDPDAFTRAVRRALEHARVVVAEPGETLRADEYALDQSPGAAAASRRDALTRADALIGRIGSLLSARDVLYVVGVSSPLAGAVHNRLTPLIAHGAGITRGWLTSPTTHRRGIVALTDLAPTVLARLGIPSPASMSGTPIRAVASDAARPSKLSSLDAQAVFRDRFVTVVTLLFIALLAGVAVLFCLLLLVSRRFAPPLVALASAVLAVPPATLLIRLTPAHRLGLPGATLVLCGIVGAVAGAAIATAGPRRVAGTALLLASFAVTAGDLMVGAPLQLNSVFGYSPIVAGRFYGNSNLDYAVLVAAGILGLLGLCDARRWSRVPVWTRAALFGLLALEGLPQFGADLGGVLAGVPAVLVCLAIAGGRRVRPVRVAAWAAAAAVAAAAAALIDLVRPPSSRTHLGRFAARVVSGGVPALWTVVSRKGLSNLGVLFSSWTWTLPIALTVLALVLWQRPDVLSRLDRDHPMLRAGIAGALVAGVLGFAVNDSGIWILGMVLAHVVAFFALIAVDLTEAGVDVRTPTSTASTSQRR